MRYSVEYQYMRKGAARPSDATFTYIRSPNDISCHVDIVVEETDDDVCKLTVE